MTHRLQQSTLTAVQPNSISNTEVAAIAKAAIGSAWTIDGCTDFVWAVTGLAGAPFFDLAGAKKLVNGDPLMPEDTAAGFAVPHGSSPNQGGDGWSIVIGIHVGFSCYFAFAR